jgi:hypothetical protein
LGLIVNGNHFQPEWPGPEAIAFLMRKEFDLIEACQFKGLDHRDKGLDVLVRCSSIAAQVFLNFP